jgi:hypothetical protein
MYPLLSALARPGASLVGNAGPVQKRGELKYSDFIWLGVLLLPAVFVLAMSVHAGEFWWTDESRHAMDGVFILDFVRDFAWRTPLDYALR